MLKVLAKHLLEVTGRAHLASFAQGLLHLGRPSPVAFPPELVEQGAAIALSGLANTMAIQSNPDWVWPVWVVRQTDPDDPCFVPTGLNLITTNLTGRNWTSVGLPGSSREAMVDPVGMVTPGPWKWSVLPVLRIGGKVHAPPLLRSAVRQETVPGTLGGVRTSVEIPGIVWSWEVVPVELEGREVAIVSAKLVNLSTESVALFPGVCLRPANPLSLGAIRDIRVEKRRIRVDGGDAVLLGREPSRCVVSDRHNGDPILHASSGLPLKSLRSRSGMATCLVEWSVELGTGASWEESFAVPMSGHEVFRPIGGRAVAHARERSEAVARRERARGTILRVPDSILQAGWDAIRERIHVFDDGDRFTPGTFLYHEHWFRDAAFLALGFENLGRGDLVAPKMELLRSRQNRDGLFRSQTGEWDSNGQAIWTLGTHLRRGGSMELAERHLRGILRGVDWIVARRRSEAGGKAPHSGLLPAGFSAEHFGPNDHYFWDNFWSIAGMVEAAWMADSVGRRQDAERIREECREYRADLESAIRWASERCGGGLPSSPYRRLDAASIGNLVAVSPLGIVEPDVDWLAPTLAHLSKNHVRDGLFFQSIVHTGLNPYLSVQLARARLATGDRDGTLEVLRALARVATPTWCWPEAVHPRTGGGCMGDGDHGWAAAEFVSLLRELLVRETSDGLELLGGVPPEWLEDPDGIRLVGATTGRGTLDLEVERRDGKIVLSWRMDRQAHQPRGALVAVLPGRSGRTRRVSLPSESGRIEFDARENGIEETHVR